MLPMRRRPGRTGSLGRKRNALPLVVASITGRRTIKLAIRMAIFAIELGVGLVQSLTRHGVIEVHRRPLCVACVALSIGPRERNRRMASAATLVAVIPRQRPPGRRMVKGRRW